MWTALLERRVGEAAAGATGQTWEEACAAREVERTELPLWLDEREAETLLELCAAAPLDRPELEPRVFGKLGSLLRRFRRAVR